MKKYLSSTICIFLLGIIFVTCESQGKPSPVGELLTVEQIAGINNNDNSWNGKLVAVKGYAQFDRKLVKLGQKNYMKISAVPDDDALIIANIGVRNAERNEGVTIAGEKSRNYIRISLDNVDITTAKFMTDDYQEAGYGEFIFSGEMVHEDGKYCLQNVTIHLPR